MKHVSAFLLSLVLSSAAFAAQDTFICLGKTPQWTPLMEGKLGDQGNFAVVIVNPEAKRVTWMGTGGSYVRITGKKNSEGVQITRIDGRPVVEQIVSQKKTGNVTDYKLEDSLGGIGLLRVSMDKSGQGRGSWIHATDDGMKEEFSYCTTNILN